MTTLDYSVVMPVVSIRLSGHALHDRLKDTAQRADLAISTLAERLIDEGLRMEAHPLVVFRNGPAGRRAVLVGGPEVADVIGSIAGGDVDPAERRTRAASTLGLREAHVDAAVAYYADHTDEIDHELAVRAQLADEAETAWRRQRALLTS